MAQWWYAFSAQFDGEPDAHEVLTTLRHTDISRIAKATPRPSGSSPGCRMVAGWRLPLDRQRRMGLLRPHPRQRALTRRRQAIRTPKPSLNWNVISDEHFQDMSRAEGRVEECESDLRNALDARHASHYWREHAHEASRTCREARAELKRAQHDYAS